MTANEMKFAWQMQFDSLFELPSPAYDDRQISYLLTQAQWQVFLKKYNPFGNKYQKGFEADEQRKRDLEQLIRPALYDSVNPVPSDVSEISESSSQNGVHPNGIFLDLPSDFLYAIEEAATLQSNLVESWVKPIKHDQYLANINNPYQQPYSGLIWRMEISRQTQPEGTTSGTSKRTELILPEGESLDKYRMRYLASPPDIVCDEFRPVNQRHCILDESIHGDIVKEAVILGKLAVNPETYQLEVAEQQRNN